MDPLMRLSLKKSDTSGFTLLELMISMMILGVLVALVFAAFRLGIRAWEKGEQGIDDLQRYRIVLDLMQAQLASVHIQGLVRPGAKPLSLGGDGRGLTLVSSRAMLPGNGKGLVAARYTVETESAGTLRLVLRETPTMTLRDIAGTWDFERVTPHVLIAGAADIAFSYLAPPDSAAGTGWLPQWDGQTAGGPPLAVKITIRKTADGAPIAAVARILPGWK
jgi:general secretion pathway protein J